METTATSSFSDQNSIPSTTTRGNHSTTTTTTAPPSRSSSNNSNNNNRETSPRRRRGQYNNNNNNNNNNSPHGDETASEDDVVTTGLEHHSTKRMVVVSFADEYGSPPQIIAPLPVTLSDDEWLSDCFYTVSRYIECTPVCVLLWLFARNHFSLIGTMLVLYDAFIQFHSFNFIHSISFTQFHSFDRY